MEQGTLTRRMDSVLNGLQKEFNALYTKEDFNQELVDLKKAEGQSDWPSVLADLYGMLDACGIDYERNKEYSYYEKLINDSDVPEDWVGAEDKMLLALYNQYEEYASSEDYMQRIVNRLRHEEDHWENNTLRLQILKQFIKYGNCLQYYSYEKGDGEKAKIKTIYGGATYIKQYLKEKLGVKSVISIEEFIEDVEDDVFDVLKSASSEQTKSVGRYAILKMVDDLANGKFRTGGATKQSLYLFAIVYGMTYYSGADNGEIQDFSTDIEINLFRDFYTNNLMRFISESYEKNLTDYDSPSGQGINYKNFAEMIYLYFISKTGYTPQEKIKLSDEMINRVKNNGNYKKGKRPQDALPNRPGTAFYKGLVKKENANDLFSEDILSLPEKEFEEFIRSNYNCNTSVGKNIVSPMQVEAEQKTAFAEYTDIVEHLKKLCREEWEKEQEQCLNEELQMEEFDKPAGAYGLWITDPKAFNDKELKNICDRNPDIDYEKFEEFIRLLSGIDYFMRQVSVDSADRVTRTVLVVAYYYYYNYNALNEDLNLSVDLKESGKKDRKKSFNAVFNDFKKGVDKKLEAAGYQPLSSKNIFDVVVVFSAYAYRSM